MTASDRGSTTPTTPSAKRDQGNRAIVTRDESTRNRIDVRITEDRIHKAVDNDEFRLLYQPIVTTQNGRVVGFEALLRWLDPGASAFVAPVCLLRCSRRRDASSRSANGC